MHQETIIKNEKSRLLPFFPNNDKIEIRATEKRGRGVYAKKDIAKGELIETCQLLIFSLPDADLIEDTKSFSNYWFSWDLDDDNRFAAFCLGSGSLYNHSSDPNAKIEKDYPNETISYRAIKFIPAGTEITFKYGTVWFEEH